MCGLLARADVWPARTRGCVACSPAAWAAAKADKENALSPGPQVSDLQFGPRFGPPPFC
jgi:hypothetical protein